MAKLVAQVLFQVLLFLGYMGFVRIILAAIGGVTFGLLFNLSMKRGATPSTLTGQLIRLLPYIQTVIVLFLACLPLLLPPEAIGLLYFWTNPLASALAILVAVNMAGATSSYAPIVRAGGTLLNLLMLPFAATVLLANVLPWLVRPQWAYWVFVASLVAIIVDILLGLKNTQKKHNRFAALDRRHDLIGLQLDRTKPIVALLEPAPCIGPLSQSQDNLDRLYGMAFEAIKLGDLDTIEEKLLEAEVEAQNLSDLLQNVSQQDLRREIQARLAALKNDCVALVIPARLAATKKSVETLIADSDKQAAELGTVADQDVPGQVEKFLQLERWLHEIRDAVRLADRLPEILRGWRTMLQQVNRQVALAQQAEQALPRLRQDLSAFETAVDHLAQEVFSSAQAFHKRYGEISEQRIALLKLANQQEQRMTEQFQLVSLLNGAIKVHVPKSLGSGEEAIWMVEVPETDQLTFVQVELSGARIRTMAPCKVAPKTAGCAYDRSTMAIEGKSAAKIRIRATCNGQAEPIDGWTEIRFESDLRENVELATAYSVPVTLIATLLSYAWTRELQSAASTGALVGGTCGLCVVGLRKLRSRMLRVAPRRTSAVA